MKRSLLVSGALVAMLVAGLSACDGDDATGGRRAGAVDVDALPVLALTEVRRIGSDQDPDTGFSNLASAAVDGDGRVYALDAQDLRIRVFDSTGTLMRMVGRRGEGPGEFEWAPTFGVAGDTLWAFDVFASRLTLFDLDGRVLSTSHVEPVVGRIPGTSFDGMQAPRARRQDGLFVGDIRGWSGGSGPKAGPEADSLTPRLLFDTRGNVVDTIEWFRPSVPSNASEDVEVGGRRFAVPSPPTDDLLTLLLSDGEILVDRRHAGSTEKKGAFTVTRRGYSGDTTYHRTFSYRPVAYSDAALDTLARRFAVGAFPADAPPPEPLPAAARAIRSKMAFPTFQPAIQGQLAGADGGVWLRREDRAQDSFEWLVLDPEGRPRGRLDIPRSTRLLWAKGDELLASVLDDVGVPWLVRYRLKPTR